MKYPTEVIVDAREYLLRLLASNSKVYCSVISVAKSGMSRRIKFYVIYNNRIINITRLMQILRGQKTSDNGMRIDGCGMDMGSVAVDGLDSTLGLGGTLTHNWI